MNIDALWEDLARIESGTAARRLIDAGWPGDLEAVVLRPDNNPGIRLTLQEPAVVDYSALEGSEYVSLHVEAEGGGVTMLQFTLDDHQFRDIFQSLCDDLVQRVLATDSEEAGAQTLVRNLSRWLRMMKRRGTGALNRERQTGLYGELFVLQSILAPVVGVNKAVDAWTGPTGELQDFQLDGGVAIETKTLSVSRPQSLKISSERQLDDNGFAALLIAHVAVDVQRGTGITLPDIVSQLRELLGEGGSRTLFEERLWEAGYHDSHAAVYQHGYTHRNQAWYRVTAAFPRIIEADLRPGMGQVSYVVDASACEPFCVDDEIVKSWLVEPPVPEQLVGAEEGQTVEFKASVWKDMSDRNIPKETISANVIKAVTGFLNASGGTLGVGVHDRARPDDDVPGIEADCDFLNIDQDRFEIRLSELLRVNIGAIAMTNAKFDFINHNGKTICNIHVRASSRPVFANMPGKNSKGEYFYVRQGGSTVELQGREAFEYMREHFG